MATSVDCTEERLPLLFGASDGDTVITAVELKGDTVIFGGHTTSPTMTPNSYTTYGAPFIATYNLEAGAGVSGLNFGNSLLKWRGVEIGSHHLMSLQYFNDDDERIDVLVMHDYPAGTIDKNRPIYLLFDGDGMPLMRRKVLN